MAFTAVAHTAAKVSIDWGPLSEWVQAVGQLIILVTVFITMRRDRQHIRALEREHRDQAERASADKASGVSVWPDDWSQKDTKIVCRNACAEPIYDVVVRASFELLENPPKVSGENSTKSIMMMRPGEELPANIAIVGRPGLQPYVDVSFRDAHGVRWWRRPDGKLVRSSREGNSINPIALTGG